jgi:SAM-dependent methyltransferase
MVHAVLRRCLLASLGVLLSATFVLAQPAKQAFKPYVGLPGKDVIWLPAELVMVNKMLDLARVTPKDVVMDLGSGDGRTVIQAGKRGARGIGVEFNPELVAYSRRLAQQEGVAERVTIERADLFEYDLSRASVITLFLLPSINMKLRPRLLELKPGTRIISNTFTMDEWQHDETARDDSKGDNCSFNCVAYLWVIPAKVGGTWRLGDAQLELQQEFQMVSGTLSAGGKALPVKGRVRGEQITFTAGNVQYTGRVSANGMEGTLGAAGKSGQWKAARAST